jgi:acid phosphatase
MHEEDMIPGTPPCARLNELKKGFDGLKAACWSGSPEMARLRHILRSVRPSGGVTVDDIPKLRDTAQCLGKACPPELLQEQALIERINVDMFQSGYYASREYSALGIGPFLASVAQDMVEGAQQRKAGPKAAIYLAHDSTILATLAGIGGHTTGRWPGFGSSVKMEMFRASSAAADTQDWRSAFYVRVIYNDVPVVIPACAPAGNHLKGHITFCTLVSAPASLWAPRKACC